MISYFRHPSHDYAMAGSCGVVYKGLGVTEVYGWNDYGYVEIRNIFFCIVCHQAFFQDSQSSSDTSYTRQSNSTIRAQRFYENQFSRYHAIYGPQSSYTMVLRIWSFHPQKFSRGKNSQLPEWNQQGHLNEGTMHFFGGVDYNMEGTKKDFRRQHFSIESNFNGKMPK